MNFAVEGMITHKNTKVIMMSEDGSTGSADVADGKFRPRLFSLKMSQL